MSSDSPSTTAWSSLPLSTLKRIEKILAAQYDKPEPAAPIDNVNIAHLNFRNGQRSVLDDVRRAIGVVNQRKE